MLSLRTLLNYVSLLNFVKPIKICSIRSSFVKISSSKNQARLPIPISFQARIKQDCQLFSSYQARIKLLSRLTAQPTCRIDHFLACILLLSRLTDQSRVTLQPSTPFYPHTALSKIIRLTPLSRMLLKFLALMSSKDETGNKEILWTLIRPSPW